MSDFPPLFRPTPLQYAFLESTRRGYTFGGDLDAGRAFAQIRRLREEPGSILVVARDARRDELRRQHPDVAERILSLERDRSRKEEDPV